MTTQRPGEDRWDGLPANRYQRRSAHLPHLGTEHCRDAVEHLPTPDRQLRRRRTPG